MNSKKEVQHVYLVGAKSLGAYGGYETFVYKLTEYHQNKENIKYHVACKANGDGCMDESKFEGVIKINDHEFEFHNAHCFKIDVPQIGSAQAIYYDVAALKACCEHIKKNHIPHPIVYIMACRIGPFAGHFYREIHKLGGTVILNPDGHEWMRAKWSAPIRKYWKISEQMMVKYCDLAICDVVNELDVPILCMGLKDVVVSASPEGILVSDKEQSSYIKPYVNTLDHRVMFAEKSWGSFKVIDIDKASMTIKVTLNAGHQMNYHSHQHRDEVWTVIAGKGKTIVDGMEQNVKAGDVITMSAGCRHTVIAETELKLIEVQLGEAIDVHDKQKFELEY